MGNLDPPQTILRFFLAALAWEIIQNPSNLDPPQTILRFFLAALAWEITQNPTVA